MVSGCNRPTKVMTAGKMFLECLTSQQVKERTKRQTRLMTAYAHAGQYIQDGAVEQPISVCVCLRHVSMVCISITYRLIHLNIVIVNDVSVSVSL